MTQSEPPKLAIGELARDIIYQVLFVLGVTLLNLLKSRLFGDQLPLEVFCFFTVVDFIFFIGMIWHAIDFLNRFWVAFNNYELVDTASGIGWKIVQRVYKIKSPSPPLPVSNTSQSLVPKNQLTSSTASASTPSTVQQGKKDQKQGRTK